MFFEKRAQLSDRVLACCILFERPRHQRSAPFVDVDGVHERATDVLAHVEVADFRAADTATLGYLVSHLDCDVFAALPNLYLVHDVGNGFHGIAHITVAELLFGGNEAYAFFQQLALSDGGVSEVAKHARAHVDDDVSHARVLVDEVEKAAELRSFRDGLRGVSRFHELCDNSGAKLDGFISRPLALGRDAVSVVVQIGSCL